jgi:hypothetical protein
MILLKQPTHGPGIFSVYTLHRAIARSHHWSKLPCHVKPYGTRPKGYEKQAKGFREWAQTPRQRRRLEANLGRSTDSGG